MQAEEIVIQRERPDSPAARALLAALDRYLAALYPPDANHILDEQALLAPDLEFFVARRAGAALGCGALRRMPAEPGTQGRPFGEIKRMYVLPEARGLRIAARLLHTLEARLRQHGIGQALLETGRDQTEAIRLYERAGYLKRGAFGGYPDNGLSLFYEKALA